MIKAYRDKRLNNAVMQNIAGRLKDEEIEALAAYFATNQATMINRDEAAMTELTRRSFTALAGADRWCRCSRPPCSARASRSSS